MGSSMLIGFDNELACDLGGADFPEMQVEHFSAGGLNEMGELDRVDGFVVSIQ